MANSEKKSSLSFDEYARLRNQGHTQDEIRQMYGIKTSSQQAARQNTAKELTQDRYFQLRNQGYSQNDIREMYGIKTSRAQLTSDEYKAITDSLDRWGEDAQVLSDWYKRSGSSYDKWNDKEAGGYAAQLSKHGSTAKSYLELLKKNGYKQGDQLYDAVAGYSDYFSGSADSLNKNNEGYKKYQQQYMYQGADGSYLSYDQAKQREKELQDQLAGMKDEWVSDYSAFGGHRESNYNPDDKKAAEQELQNIQNWISGQDDDRAWQDWVAQNVNGSRDAGSVYRDASSRAGQLESQKKEMEESKPMPQDYIIEQTGALDYDAYTAAYAQWEDQYNRFIQDEYDPAQKDLTYAKRTASPEDSGRFLEYTTRDDFEERSKPSESKIKLFGGDQKYDYINNINGFQNTMDASMRSNDWYKYHFMTDEERGVYNYIYDEQGQKAADEFLDSIDAELGEQRYRQQSEIMTDMAESSTAGKIAASALTVAAQPIRAYGGLMAGVDDAIRLIDPDKEINPYSRFRLPSQITQDVRSGISEDMSGVGRFAYNTAMSALDSAMNAANAGALAGGLNLGTDATMKATNTIASLLMSSEVASMAMSESKQKGYSDLGATAIGLIRGAIEYGSEHIGGEWVIKNVKANPLNALKTMVLNMIPEGTEEVMSDAANGAVNLVIDALFGTQESGIPALLDHFRNSDKEWQRKNPELATVLSILGDEALSFLGGAFATVGSSGVQTYNMSRSINQTAQQLNTTKEDVVKLMESLGTESPEGVAIMAELYDASTAKELRERMTDTAEAQQILQGIQRGDAEGIISAREFSVQKSNERALNDRINQMNDLEQQITDARKELDRLSPTDQAGRRAANERIKTAEEQLKALRDQGLQDRYSSYTAEQKAASVKVDGKDMTVKGLTMESGSAQVKLADADGNTTTVEIDDARLPDPVRSLALKTKSLGWAASAAFEYYKPGTNINEYVSRIQTIRSYAADKINRDAFMNSKAVQALDNAPLAEFLYSQGQKIAADREAAASALSRKLEQIQEAAAEKTGNGTVRSKGKGKVDITTGADIEGRHFEGIKGKKLSKTQNAVVKMVNSLANTLNIDYVIYDGETGGVQGAYHDGVVYLNINAGRNVNGTFRSLAAETLSHELTHFIEQFAPKEYEDLRAFVVETIMNGDEQMFERRVRQKLGGLDPASAGDRYDGAVREVVADACTTMLQNSEAVTQLARQNLTLAQKIQDFITETVALIKEAFAESGDDTYRAERRAMENELDRLQQLWDEGIFAASTNYNALQTTGIKNTARGEQFMAWDSYSEHEIENWKNSKKIVIYENEDQLLEFVRDAKAGKLGAKKMYFGKVSQALATRIKAETGIDTKGFNITLAADEIQKIFKDHGIEEKEVTRGQRAITDEDFIDIPIVISEADTISRSPKDWNGKPVIDFRKEISGRRTVSAYVSDKKSLDLRVQTMYAGKNKSLATPTDEQASVNTPKANDGTALNLNIPQSAAENNPQYDDTISPVTDQYQTADSRAWDDMTPEERQAEINAAMTMQQAKTMIQKAFVAAGIKEWYDGEYGTGDDWIRAEGVSEVAMYIENEYELQEKYINGNQHIVDDDYTIEEVLEAYLNGTLTGRVKPSRQTVDTSTSRGYTDNRFYAPNRGTADLATWAKANEKVSAKNRDEVYEARKNILLAAHNGNIESELGITATELNKKLRSWSNYPSSARNLSMRINSGVAPENQWTGIQNSSILNGMSMTDDDIAGMVKEITGAGDEYKRRYIGNTMLALDTHIDWSWLSVDFKPGYADENRRSVRGLYDDDNRQITVGGSGHQNTVSHEMGHALDYQWVRDLFPNMGRYNNPLSENAFAERLLADDDSRKFYKNFRSFINELTDVSSNYSRYTMEPKEVFARFVAKFVEWTQKTAGAHTFDDGFYHDNFSTSHYMEFARLLQEKAALDSKQATVADKSLQFQRADNLIEDTEFEIRTRDDRINELMAENKVLEEAVTKLKQQAKKLGKEMKLSRGPQETRLSDARKLAGEILKETGSSQDAKAIANRIKEIGDYLSESADVADYKYLHGLSVDIARDIVSDVNVELDDGTGAEELRKDFKAALRNRTIYVPEQYRADTGDWVAFKKKYFGIMKFSNNGVPIDQLYTALLEEMPGVLDPDINNPGDMINELAEKWDAMQPVMGNPFGDYMNEAIEHYANQILQAALDGTLRTAETYADRMNARLDKERAEKWAKVAEIRAQMNDRLNQLRSEKNERIEEVRQQGLARKQEAVAKERAEKWAKVEKTKKYYQDMAKRATVRRRNTATRGQIRDLIGELNSRLLRPTEKRYVPAPLVKDTIEILEMIDLSTERSGEKLQAKLAMLQQKYSAMKNDSTFSGYAYDPIMDEMIQNMAKTVGDTPLNKMSMDQLSTVLDTLKALNHMIKTAVTVKINGEERDAYEIARGMTKETKNAKGTALNAFSQLYNKYVIGTMRPDIVFEYFAGFTKGSQWSQVAEMLNEAQRKGQDLQMQFARIFDEVLNDTQQVRKLTSTKDADMVDIGLKDEDGNAVKITRDFMLALYLNLFNEDNVRHIMRGGMQIPNFKEYLAGKGDRGYGVGSVRVHGISERLSEIDHAIAQTTDEAEIEGLKKQRADILAEGEMYINGLLRSIESQLTDYDRKWVAAWRQFSEESTKVLNDTTMEVYGIKKATVENYFPIITDKNFINAPMENLVHDMTLENAGFMKERVSASGPIKLMGLSDIVNMQANRTAQYAAIMPATRAFGKIYNKTMPGYSTSVQDALNSKFGGDGKKFVENLMQDLQGGRKADYMIFDRLRGRMAQATLSLNPRVALAQTASFPTAAAELGWKPVLKALAKGGKNNWTFSGADRDLIAKYSSALWYRSRGYTSVEMGDVKNMNQLQHKVMDKVGWAMNWINFMDTATVGRLWYAAQYYIDEQNPDLEKGSDAYYEAVAEAFNRTVERTQPNYTTMQRPELLRNPHALVRQLAMFMTQRLQNQSIMYGAAAKYLKYRSDLATGKNGITEADVQQAGIEAARAATSQVVAAATIVVFQAICDTLLHRLKRYRDEDENITAESVSLTMLDNFANSLISNMFLGSEVYSVIKSIVTGEKYYGIELSGVTTLTDAVENAVKFAQKPSWPMAKKLGEALAQYLGIPAANAEKIGMALWYHMQDAMNGEFLSFESDVERTNAQNAKLLTQAYLTGNKENVEKFSGAFKDEDTMLGSVRDYVKSGYVVQKGTAQTISKDQAVQILIDAGMRKKDAEDKVQEWTCEIVTGIPFSKIKDEYMAGNIGESRVSQLLQTYGGLKKEDADRTARGYACEKDTGHPYSDLKEAYLNGEISKTELEAALRKYGQLKQGEATKRRVYYDFLIENPEADISEERAYAYMTKVKPTGISAKEFTSMLYDVDADTNGSFSQDEVGKYLNAKHYTTTQNDALWETFGNNWKISFDTWQVKTAADAAGTGKGAGNGNVSQDELGYYLVEQIRAGRMTQSQANKYWSSLMTTSKKDFSAWCRAKRIGLG